MDANEKLRGENAAAKDREQTQMSEIEELKNHVTELQSQVRSCDQSPITDEVTWPISNHGSGQVAVLMWS